MAKNNNDRDNGTSDFDSDEFDLEAINDELQDPDSDEEIFELTDASDAGQTIALGDEEDLDLLDELLKQNEAEEEPGTIQLDPDSEFDFEEEGTKRLSDAGSQRGSDTGGGFSDSTGSSDPFKTQGTGPVDSSQVVKIWEKMLGSGPNKLGPGHSIELPNKKAKLGEEFHLNPRTVKYGAGKIEDEQRIDYRVGRLVGKGAMGEVYLAEQIAVDRNVAFKKIQPKMIETEAKREKNSRRFLTEAHITAALDHPNIVTIHDLGIDQDDKVFYCMEFVDGEEWHRLFEDNSVEENVEILMSVAGGIAYAHSKGIIHRDLKPENIMIGSYQQVLIMDWGLAVDLNQGKPTSAGGTPAYLAPEMANPKQLSKINQSSDIYLLGAVLHQICTGLPPHPGRTVAKCIKAAVRNEFIDVEPFHESLRPLLNIALKAMEMNQEDRYKNAEAFQAAIRDYQTKERSFKQSYDLTDRSEKQLAEAEANRNYEVYSTALFGFREAANLYPDNQSATEGVAKARLSYASCALQQNDFELGLSLLDENNQMDRPLVQELRKAKKKVDGRKKLVSYLTIAATTLLALLALGSMSVSYTHLTLPTKA